MKYKNLFISTTDTVVGIGAPISPKNLSLLFEIKKRPRTKGIIIMVSNYNQARKLDGWNDKAEEFAKKVWPGATTLVLSESVAVRMPDKKGLLNLIDDIGPIYMTSANISGKKQLSFEEAIKEFPMIERNYNFGVGSGKPSTIIRVEDGKVFR